MHKEYGSAMRSLMRSILLAASILSGTTGSNNINIHNMIAQSIRSKATNDSVLNEVDESSIFDFLSFSGVNGSIPNTNRSENSNNTNSTSHQSISMFNYTDTSDIIMPKLQKLLMTGNYTDIFTKPSDNQEEEESDKQEESSDHPDDHTINQQTISQTHALQLPNYDNFLYISQPEGHTTDNCYIVKIRENVEKATFEKLAEVFGVLEAKVHKAYKHGFKGYSICFEQNVLPLTIMREIPWIEFVERDKKIKASQIQEPAPWGLARLSSPDLSANSFGFDATGEGVSVYVIDSGLEQTKELAGRAELGFSAFPDQPADCSGHGTEVSSVIAGLNVGVAKQARVIVAQVLDCQGDGTNSDLIDAISWVIATHQKPAVINMSLGGDRSPSVDKAVKAAIDAGIPVIVAAGNSNVDACLQSPAAVAEAITVAASSQVNTRAKFSNYGPCVDIFAPGVNILTAATVEKSRNGWAFVSGTSFSSPFVAGVAALLLEKNPGLTPAQLFEEIKSISAKSVISESTLRGSPNLLLQAPVVKSKLPILVDLTDPAMLPALGYHTSSVASIELILVICAFVFAGLALVATGIALYRRYRRRRNREEPTMSAQELKATILNAHRPSVFL